MSVRNITVFAVVLALWILIPGLEALVPPHPFYKKIPAAFEQTRIDLPNTGLKAASREVANQILVLRVQFSDLSFIASPSYPDDLAHDDVFFDRWMVHLGDFFADASHGSYALDYTLWPQVFTLPHPIAYYGGDTTETIDARVEQMMVDLITAADDPIDFSQYGGIIVFHAGAGQEADISGIRTDSIWSTFVTRKNLQDALDPENDDYPGISTEDGISLKNIVLVGESEFHDYFPVPPDQDASSYLFSIYGVLAHQFGHLIGLPTLFDNDSSNGVSQGIGNWGLMGTGVWNASGYVPAQLCAWSRYYLGWEQAIVLSHDTVGAEVEQAFALQPNQPRLYRIPISATEYFLVENRQQNPDGSTDPYTGAPSYSFVLLPPGEQDYYENYPELPFFNFMENRYKGSEWDFMLPGLGGPLLSGQSTPDDGSGILIWHIDENIITANFEPDFEINRINANALHKGVDLEEADGIEHLDVATPDPFKYGSPNDSFRSGNNAYFGSSAHDGILWLPSAESYYGGNPLEIYDISESGLVMSFSVRFGWSLSSTYTGANTISAAMLDFDNDGDEEIFHPMPDGELYLWDNEALATGFPVSVDTLAGNFTWDGQTAYLPIQRDNLIRLRSINHTDGIRIHFNLNNCSWASHPVDIGSALLLPFNLSTDSNSVLQIWDKATETRTGLGAFSQPIRSNLSYFREDAYLLTGGQTGFYTLNRVKVSEGANRTYDLPIPADSLVVGIFMLPLRPDDEFNLVVQTSHAVYLFDQDFELCPGFPFVHDKVCTAPLSFADVNRNGSWDILLGTDSGSIVLDYAGMRMGSVELPGVSGGDFSAGIRALDIDHDGKLDLTGNFCNNRLAAWDQGYRLKPGFPVSFASRSRLLPLLGKASDDKYYLWTTADDGKVFRKELPLFNPADADTCWFTEYGNLRRTASLETGPGNNQYSSTKLFVPGEVFIYPNPLKSTHAEQITLSVMTSRDTPLNLKVYDISGMLVYQNKGLAKAYLQNRELFNLPASRLRSGIYIAVVSAAKDQVTLKFAVEK